MTKRNQNLSVILATLLLAVPITAASCGSADVSGENNGTGTVTETEAPEETYHFTGAYQGETFRVLNAEDIFSYHEVIDPKEETGEALNDAQYLCCRTLEEKMGITYAETNIDLQDKLAPAVTEMVLAGDDLYDVVYIGSREYYTFGTSNYVYNLLDVDGLQLDQPWWLHENNDLLIINNKLYSAEGYSQMSIVDGMVMLLFNETMADDLDLDLPYQAVKDGKWTLDLFSEYLRAAANLNGDAEFKWTTDGNCVWGIALPNNGNGTQFTIGADVKAVEAVNGSLKMVAGDDRFYNACSKIADMFKRDNGWFYWAPITDDQEGSYVDSFERQRVLFGRSEVAKTNRLRYMEFAFGVLPFPKYDEAQERYYIRKSYPSLSTAIPTSVKDPEKSAAFADAFNYLGYEIIWPVFREVTLEQKNLRDENGAEMLDIILKSSMPDVGGIFSVGSDYLTEVGDKLKVGDDGIASILAKYESQINEKLDEVNNQ